MAKGLGVREVREAARAQGDGWFTAEMIADELDVEGKQAMKAIWKALQFLDRQHELQKQPGNKGSRWRCLRLRPEAEEQAPRVSRALEFAMLGWRPR